jgi:endonuclease YncB( thermonuclease family)
VHVLDGDTVMVEKTDQTRVVVRLLGIKALDPTHDRYGRDAAAALRNHLTDQPARVRVQQDSDGRAKIDRHERVIAELFVGDRNLGITLVKDGLALVYTVYPFDAINTYLEHQARARELERGLWGDPDAATRANAMIAAWTRRQSE